MNPRDLDKLRYRVLSGLADDLRLFRAARNTARRLVTSHNYFELDMERCTGAISDARARAKNRRQFYRDMVRKYGV